MPKLPKGIQKAAEEAEVRDFTAMPPGLYHARVKEVDTTKKSAAGNPKWIFIAEIVSGPNDPSDTQYAKRQLFEHCALTDAAAWKLKSIFTALGYTMDSDADELVGEECDIVVSQGEIAEGDKKGQMSNNIDAWLLPTGEDLVGAGAGGKTPPKGKKDDGDF